MLGSGGYGQLGYGHGGTNRGDNANEMGDNLPTVDLGTGKTAKQIFCYFKQTCAILNDDTVKCWGYNGDRQLGYGDSEGRGDGPNEMGDNLPVVDLGLPAITFTTAQGSASIRPA